MTSSLAVVRPAREADLPSLLELAAKAGVGLTTLPNNADILAARIVSSQQAFAASVTQPGGQSYLFVAEMEGQVVACSAIIAAVGTEQAFYNYHVGRSVFASRELSVYRSIPTLYLSNDLTGSSELATLFVDPQWRQARVGQLISLSRFLFIAANRQRFADRVIAELRGVADEHGRSPFWESLGRQFFAMDFSEADSLSGADTRAFIAELMPRHPVYTVLLSQAARDVIGEVHVHTRAARKILEAEGFHYRQYVDIFDAGPALEAETDNILSIRKARPREAKLCTPSDQSVSALVSTLGLADFRAIRVPVNLTAQSVGLSSESLRALGAVEGQELLVRRLHSA